MDQLFAVVLWYLLLAVLGWLVVPIAFHFLRALPDRGYAFVRPLGLLLWGFIFWTLSSYGVLRNDHGGLTAAALLLAALSWWALRQQPHGDLRQWLRANKGTVIAMEVLFLLAFVFMALVRTARPEINHTEQPMELAFINAILRSPAMPPHDPWLSGYSISYYYFGYLMVAMMAKMVGVIGSVAFNLGFVTIFASAALGAYGIAYNLLALYKLSARRAMLWLAGLAPLFVLILGNAEGLLEILHSRHLFWNETTSPPSSQFWAWMDIDDLTLPPAQEPSWTPRLYGSGAWWWWRASRVINDKTLSGGDQELIDEFPAFSFTLGDLHPHVLSMPFAMLAVGLALNVYLGGAERKEPLLGLKLREDAFLFSAVLLGALGFLNIWDFPIYAGLFGLAYILRQAQLGGWNWERGTELIGLGFALLVAGILAYLPFYLSFTSQAGGILPNLINPSRGIHVWVMFGLLFLVLLTYILNQWSKERTWGRLFVSILYGFLFVAAVWLLSLAITWLYSVFMSGGQLGGALAALGAPDLSSLLSTSLSRRWAAAGGWITLGVFIGAVFGLLVRRPAKQEPRQVPSSPQAKSFLMLLLFVGTLLVIVPEFIYLKDQFGTRMNTVFKFYFQAWQMWSVAAAVAAVILLEELRRWSRVLFVGLLTLVIGVGLIYPVFSFSDITRNGAGSLDGASYLSPDVREAIAWLRQAPLGPVVEAIGGSYDASYARNSAHSGQPTLMGWPGHEGQWRGGNVDWARIDDVRTLYTAEDWATAHSIIERYGVEYIVVGDVERFTYTNDQMRLVEQKFAENLQIAFQNATVTIYQVP